VSINVEKNNTKKKKRGRKLIGKETKGHGGECREKDQGITGLAGSIQHGKREWGRGFPGQTRGGPERLMRARVGYSILKRKTVDGHVKRMEKPPRESS